MLVATERRPQRRTGERPGPRRREKSLLDPPMARERVLDALQRQRSVLDGTNHRLERRELRLLRRPRT